MAKLTNYEQMRDGLNTGDLLQWRGDYPFSHIIRHGTKEYYNHASFLLRLGEYSNHVYSIEALDNGLFMYRLSTLMEAYEGHVDVFPLKPDYRECAKAAAAWLLDRQGVPYDWSGCLSNRGALYRRFGFERLADATVKPADEAQLFCSESIFLAFKEGPQEWHMDPIDHLQPVTVSPVPGNEMIDTCRLWQPNERIDRKWRGIRLAERAVE